MVARSFISFLGGRAGWPCWLAGWLYMGGSTNGMKMLNHLKNQPQTKKLLSTYLDNVLLILCLSASAAPVVQKWKRRNEKKEEMRKKKKCPPGEKAISICLCDEMPLLQNFKSKHISRQKCISLCRRRLSGQCDQ